MKSAGAKRPITIDTFFEKFDLFADAPDAVERMRELELQLAVRGKLVEQYAAEDDGLRLLNRIQENKHPITGGDEERDSALSFPSIPDTWILARFSDVVEIVRGVTFPGSSKTKEPSDGDIACLRTASVQAEIDWHDLIYISPNYVRRSDQWVAKNDVIISMANSYDLVGKVAIVRDVPLRATFGAFLAAIRPIGVDAFYLLYVLRSPWMQAAFRASSSQTTNIANISLGRMRPLPFPLPPLAETYRRQGERIHGPLRSP